MHGVLLATDGLWDELRKQEVADIFAKHYLEEETFLRRVLDQSLTTAAMRRLVKKDELERMAQGARRDFHDDISIVFVPLDRD